MDKNFLGNYKQYTAIHLLSLIYLTLYNILTILR